MECACVCIGREMEHNRAGVAKGLCLLLAAVHPQGGFLHVVATRYFDGNHVTACRFQPSTMPPARRVSAHGPGLTGSGCILRHS